MSTTCDAPRQSGLLSFIASGNTITMLLVLATVCSMYYMHTEMCRLDDRLTYAMSKKSADTELLKLLSEINQAKEPTSAKHAASVIENEAAAPATKNAAVEVEEIIAK